MQLALQQSPHPSASAIELAADGYGRKPVTFDSSWRSREVLLFTVPAEAYWGRVDRLSLRDERDNEIAGGVVMPPVELTGGDVLEIQAGGLVLAGYGMSSVSVLPPGDSPQYFTLPAAETVLPGMPVYIDGEGKLAKADATAIPNAGVIGLAVSEADVNEMCAYATDSHITRQDWTAITGSAQLTPGATYYLDYIPGRLTKTPPAQPDSAYSVICGKAIYPDMLDIEISQPIGLI